MKRTICLTALGLLAGAPAFAQGFDPSRNGAAPVVGSAPAAKRADPAPRALPGARAEPTAVAPPSKNVGDLPPTEALFDAINRGDLPAAKDAVNRGADLSGHNVLGLTPLEQSVDLGRNEISFLLLSMRGAGSAGSAPPAPTPKTSVAESRAERLTAQKAERAAARSRVPVAGEAAPAAPRTARLFAGDGGAPVPQAGFLGFDANR